MHKSNKCFHFVLFCFFTYGYNKPVITEVVLVGFGQEWVWIVWDGRVN